MQLRHIAAMKLDVCESALLSFGAGEFEQTLCKVDSGN
jgi:hypothetical protein